MSNGSGAEIWQAAMLATLAVDILIHPIETLITRIQSPSYSTHYKTQAGSLHRNFFSGLYQGFGPTLLAGLPASVAFFMVYEGAKTAFHGADGPLGKLPLPLVHVASSATADAVACAIMNPAEVLKQNAQVLRAGDLMPGQRSQLAYVLRGFVKHPTRLWAGYTTLTASHLPGTCLTFGLYESLKASFLYQTDHENDLFDEVRASTISGALAGGLSAGLFVPIDVIKTRVRLAAGDSVRIRPKATGISGHGLGHDTIQRPRVGPLTVAREVLRNDGIRGLFRGFTLTCLAAAIGSGLFLGCYDGCKMYLRTKPDDDEAGDFLG